jgi:hypothetical protein
VWHESLYDLWCKKSNFAVLYPSSYGPVANARGITTVNGAKTNTSTGISKNNAVFIWDKATPHPRHCLEHDQCCSYLWISYFARVKPIIYEKPNLVLKFKSISIIWYYFVVLSILNISMYKYSLY